MNRMLKRLSLLLIYGMGGIGFTLVTPKVQAQESTPFSCVMAVNSTNPDADGTGMGPDDTTTDGNQTRKSSDPDIVRPEYPSRRSGSSSDWDGGSGAGGPFSGEF